MLPPKRAHFSPGKNGSVGSCKGTSCSKHQAKEDTCEKLHAQKTVEEKIVINIRQLFFADQCQWEEALQMLATYTNLSKASMDAFSLQVGGKTRQLQQVRRTITPKGSVSTYCTLKLSWARPSFGWIG